MANDSFTTLNLYSGGDSMDESALTYGVSPTTRKRARVVLGDDATAAALAAILNISPVGTEYGVGARIIPGDVTTGSTALGAPNAAIQIALAGQNGASFQLAAGTLVGTIIPEVSFDGGTTWWATFFDDPVTSTKATSIVFGSSNTLTARSVVAAAGCSHVRVRVSAYTSGTANAIMRASLAFDPSVLYASPDGTAGKPPTICASGGYDGANVRVLKTDTNGRQIVLQQSGTGAPTSVATTTTPSTTILAANSARLGAAIFNECTTGGPILYLALGATCTTSSYTVQVPANGYYEVPYGYTGIITGVWSTVTGATAARVTQVTN